jgi:hypothetical protein
MLFPVGELHPDFNAIREVKFAYSERAIFFFTTLGFETPG